MKYRLQNTKYRIQLNRSEWFAVTAKLLAEREMLSCIWHWKMHLPQMTERRIHHISLAIKPKVGGEKARSMRGKGLRMEETRLIWFMYIFLMIPITGTPLHPMLSLCHK